jgi:hypothetical protein
MPLVREDIWNGAFKFTSERHPYEKAVSYAYYRLDQMKNYADQSMADRTSADFAKYLDDVVRNGKYASFKYYSIDGRPVVDDFIKLESLRADLARIGARIGIPIPDELPRRRRGKSRPDMRPAREILSDEQKQIVWEHCRPEFELLGYER